MDQLIYLNIIFEFVGAKVKEKKLQPRERIELSTPGLQVQCSNHWADEADTLVVKIDKTTQKNSKQRQQD